MDKIAKVLHVVNLASFGGIQKLVIELSQVINYENLIECEILATQQVDTSYELLPKNVTIIEVHQDGFFSKIRKVLKVMKNADIIHFHGPYTFFQFIGIFANRKIVYTEHSTLQKANIKNTPKHFIQKRIFGKLYLEYISTIIFISEWIQKDLALKNKNQVVIYNGLSYLEPKVVEQQDFILTIAARLIRKKRVHLAVELMHKLRDYPSVKLQIIGDGRELDDLKKLAGDLMDKSVFFLGFKQNAYDIIASSDIYLMTTDMEGFGLVVLEAMMSKTLVLALSDSGGPTEILHTKFSNLIVNGIDEMAQSILYWKDNLNEKKKVECELKELYTESYTMNSMANNYLNVYLQVLENPKR